MTDRIGQQLANYRLISILGQGGFADVYLGEHIYLDTLAAIKVLQMRLTDEDKQSFVYAVAWAQSGQYIASASSDKTVQVWLAV